METLADAFIKRILNTESEFIWKNKEEDDAHVIRYEYDPRPDKLGNYEPKKKRDREGEFNDDPHLYRMENGRWRKRSRGLGYVASTEPHRDRPMPWRGE